MDSSILIKLLSKRCLIIIPAESCHKFRPTEYDLSSIKYLKFFRRRYNLNKGENTTDEYESEEDEEEGEIPSSRGFNEFALALPDRRAQFTVIPNYPLYSFPRMSTCRKIPYL